MGVGARAMVYHALAEALAGPVPGIQILLLRAVTAGAQELDSPACRTAALTLAELGTFDLEVLREAYARLKSGGDGRPVVLYESLFRYGRLAGPATWEVEEQYRRLGLAPADGELPDHASVELACLSLLAAAEAQAQADDDDVLVTRLRAAQRSFLRNHAAAWLPQVGSALANSGEPFYALIGRLLSEFLWEELNGRERDRRTDTRLPALSEPASCTLCGLCVGSCPLGALAVVESGTQTALTLTAARCVGCDRCVRICPEEVLTLMPGTGKSGHVGKSNGTGHQILRRSRRARCPRCGRPTVSQAELSAVFARLHADSAMRERLSLCIECKSGR